MRFSDPPRRQPPESIVPMINVVFLLLIFFLMTAQIAPPEPFEVVPPEAESQAESEGELIVYLSGEGEVAFRDASGADAALAALERARESLCTEIDCEAGEGPPVVLRADAAASGQRLAELMPRLGALGFARVDLVTAAP